MWHGADGKRLGTTLFEAGGEVNCWVPRVQLGKPLVLDEITIGDTRCQGRWRIKKGQYLTSFGLRLGNALL